MRSKKLLALLVASVMCLSALLTSCDKLSKKDIEADPAGRIDQSIRETADSIAKSLSPLEPLRAAEKKGRFELNVAPADSDVKVGLNGAYDTDAKKFAGDISVGSGDTSATLKLYTDNGKLAVSVPELFEGAYGVDSATLAEDMKNSPLLSFIAGEENEEFMNQLEPMLSALNGASDASSLIEAANKLDKDMNGRLNKCVSSIEKKDVTIGGKEVKAFEVVFKLQKADFVDMMSIFKDDFKPILEGCEIMTPSSFYDNPGSQSPADMFDSVFDTLIEDINKEGNDVNVEITAYLSPKTCDFMGCRGAATAVSGENKSSAKVEFGIELDEKPGKLTGTYKITEKTENEDEKVICDAKFALECTDDDKTFSVKLTADADLANYEYTNTEDGDSMEVKGKDTHSLIIDFNNDKAAKTYVLKSEAKTVYDGNDERILTRGEKDFFELSGKLEYDATSLSLSADKLVYGHGRSAGGDPETWLDPEQGEIDGIGLTFKLSTDAGEITMPEYKNILKLNEGELLDLALEAQGNIQKITDLAGKLGLLIIDPPAGGSDKTYFDICDSFDDSFDYNLDGKIDEVDRAEWEAEFKQYGSLFDETYDYDGDGEVGTAADRDTYEMMVSMFQNMPVDDESYIASTPNEDDGRTYFDICETFDESFDYNIDGKVDESDRTEWEAEFKPFGSVFDESFDYDSDGTPGTDEDRKSHSMMVSMFKTVPLNDIDAEDDDTMFNPYTMEYDPEWDYDYDGKADTAADREEYEKYYKIYVEKFDPTVDYDQDGKVDADDREFYDMVRSDGYFVIGEKPFGKD